MTGRRGTNDGSITAERVFAVLGVVLLGIGLFNLYDPPGLFEFLSPGDFYVAAIMASFFVLVLGFIFTMGAIVVSMHKESDSEVTTPETTERERRARRAVAGLCLAAVLTAAWWTFVPGGTVAVTAIGSLQFLVVLTLVGTAYVVADSVLIPRIVAEESRTN